MAAIFIFNGFYAIAYTPLLVSYTVEITPYAIRAKMFAVMNGSSPLLPFLTTIC